MSYLSSHKSILIAAVSLILLLVIGRLAVAHFDSTYFIVAGTDFVDTARTPSPVIVQPGQGYDGQFFYRYALHPFDLTPAANGITTDHPAYRIQRIGYPFMAWLLSAGGRPYAVPWAMLLLNIVAFAGIFFYTGRFITLMGGNVRQGLLPLLLCGLYMSLARDLSEVVELFFFTGALYYLFTSRYLLLCVFATLTIFCRETSVIAFLPLAACLLIRQVREGVRLPAMVAIVLPFLLFAVWKLIIYTYMVSPEAVTSSYRSLGIPFKGIISGFLLNYDLSDTRHILQFLFWVMYFIWQVLFAIKVCSAISLRSVPRLDNVAVLKVIYLVWLLFAVCFTDTIYCDDWGFVRIFSLWGMTGILILIAEKKRTHPLFNIYSATMVLLTIARLIIKV